MAVASAQASYAAQFEELSARRASEPSWLAGTRRSAMDAFTRLGIPTTRDEEWRFTNVTALADQAFGEAPAAEVAQADLAPFLVRQLSATLLVFVNGRFAPALSSARSLPKGVIIGSLGEVLASDPGLVDPYFSKCAAFDAHAFCALNTAFTGDGGFLYIPSGVSIADPVHVLYYTTTDAPAATHPRTIVVVGDRSSLTLIESYAGRPGAAYFTNAVTEFVVGEHSHTEHYRVQRESMAATHISSTHIYLEKAAVFAQQSFTFGGALARNDVNALLDAEGIACTLNGLYLGHDRRLIDNHTAIVHAKPHCESHEIYKGMLDGHSKGVFNGKIFVRPDAQKTDAKQTNKVLLLSDDATINTKPQLEIFADDVKCTHGATVGQLDAESLFYLRARGIGAAEARAMLVHAFASDVIDRVTIEPLRAALEDTLLEQLPKDLVA
ncbi:MAG: Fe-S cluster assembly protein SufD [Vicinamibacteraceae bacterium]|nr:Fe-S cluster assembly protein SufD [Vicinamibacteraceae bacterium]